MQSTRFFGVQIEAPRDSFQRLILLLMALGINVPASKYLRAAVVDCISALYDKWWRQTRASRSLIWQSGLLKRKENNVPNTIGISYHLNINSEAIRNSFFHVALCPEI